MPTRIQYLKPGTRFCLSCDPAVTGTFVDSSGCSATVRLDGGVRDTEFADHNGEARHFRASRTKTTTWALATLVEPTSNPEGDAPSQNEESDMATKTATKKAGTKKGTKAKAVTAKAKSNGKLSALDAAAKVLGENKEPMNTKSMIEAMAAKGYWKSPGGKTPHATLYSAILREIDTKGSEARFKKADRGMFTLRS
jgi:hypothetical protein